MRRREPRPLGHAISALAESLAPQTLLADVQRVWVAAVGETIAAPVGSTWERDGVLVVTCSSAVWAQELDLMGPELASRLNALLGAAKVRSLRCQAVAARGWGE